MKSRAPVLGGVGKDWEIHEVDIDAPRDGEVLVKMAMAGVCHGDDHFATGDGVPTADMAAMMEAAGAPVPDLLPMLGGHEGAGVVVDVGQGVTDLRPGDHVAASFIPPADTVDGALTGRASSAMPGPISPRRPWRRTAPVGVTWATRIYSP